MSVGTVRQPAAHDAYLLLGGFAKFPVSVRILKGGYVNPATVRRTDMAQDHG